MKEKTYYIAEDGTQFESERECKQYERGDMFEKMIAESPDIIKYPEAEGMQNLGADFSTDDYRYLWYKPLNEAGTALLKRAYGCIDDDPTGKIICIEIAYNDTYYSYLGEGIRYAKNLLSKLGYDMVLVGKGALI